MDKDLFKRIVHVLTPHMTDVTSRQALLQQALFSSPVLNQINMTGSAANFTIQLVTTLNNYETLSLIVVLDTLRDRVGKTRQQEITELIDDLRQLEKGGASSDDNIGQQASSRETLSGNQTLITRLEQEILRCENARLSHRKEYDLGRIGLAVLEARLVEVDERIAEVNEAIQAFKDNDM